MEHVGSDQSSPRNTRGSSTWSLPPVPGVAPLEEAETGWRRSTEVAIGARARSVPDRSVSRGAQRCRRTTPGCQFGCISAGQSSATGESGKIPKLRARVRFSSPAPHESPRPAARGFFVAQTNFERRITYRTTHHSYQRSPGVSLGLRLYAAAPESDAASCDT